MKRVIVAVLCVVLLGTGLVVAAQPPQEYTIVAGDTLRKVAAHYGTTVLELLDLNPGITPDNLQIGQKIALPLQPLWSYHVVQAGDSVKLLAEMYKVPLQALREANELKKDQLTVGEMIRIPMHLYLGEAQPVTHRVEIGETLYEIAQAYKVTLTQLAQWNNLQDLNSIMAGQTLIVG
mgnify:CR=1 FL=1|jgi:LysM repeat protein